MDKDVQEVLYSEEMIAEKVREMGAAISRDYEGKNLLLVSVLKGSVIFMADLMRAAQIKSDLEFMSVSSYANATESSGRVHIVQDVQQDITGRDIIIVEDILDSGNTLAFLKQYLLNKGAASITIVTLLDKPARRAKAITADFAGFVVPDEFVVGYGLDYAQKYRNVPYIGVLKPEVYSGE
jgi:hypoxanthine phosphoribosyltransferase